MDLEEISEGVLAILQELHEDIRFEAEEKMVDDKILDSFDLVTLVTELGEEFDDCPPDGNVNEKPIHNMNVFLWEEASAEADLLQSSILLLFVPAKLACLKE